jgi:predicted esterase YcpF (UPF0227 family)
MQDLIYLHGFLSSPQSEKAQQCLAFVKKHYPALNIHIPQLSGDITKAVATIESLIATLPKRPLHFIGSSMGGFLSTYFIEKYAHLQGGKAVVVNPAVAPYNLLKNYQGQHVNPYSQEHFTISPASIEHLHDFDTPKLTMPNRYMVLLQSGDETLDYRLAMSKYKGANITLEEGGNHSFVNFDEYLPQIFRFLN